MTGIGPNIAAALMQTSLAAEQVTKPGDAQRNKRLRDSRELAQLADQQEHEVEDAEHIGEERVHRDGEQQRQPQDSQYDSYEQQLQHDDEARDGDEVAGVPLPPEPPGQVSSSSDAVPSDDLPPKHIDISI